MNSEAILNTTELSEYHRRSSALLRILKKKLERIFEKYKHTQCALKCSFAQNDNKQKAIRWLLQTFAIAKRDFIKYLSLIFDVLNESGNVYPLAISSIV